MTGSHVAGSQPSRTAGAERRTAPLLELRGVTKRYGELIAVHDVDLVVEPGERRALIGPNGAGKTTLFNMIGGKIPVTRGTIRFKDRDITRMPEHRRAQLGMAKTFQHSTLFDGVSAFDNIAIAVQAHLGMAGRMWRPARKLAAVNERVEVLLQRVGLADRPAATAGALSHGERRQLEVAVALATEPELILLDEPVAGMSRAESDAFVEMIGQLTSSETFIIIEHDMDVVFAIASRITVLQGGAVLTEGTAEQIRSSPEVQEAYLGGGHAEQVFHVR